MRTTELFKFNRSSKRISESLQKTFGTKINFEEFDTAKLEDARNKLRTQIHTARTESGFNENLENDTLSKAQFMHDAIVAELMDRQEHIVDNTQVEAHNPEVEEFLQKVAQSGDDGFDMLYAAQNGKYGNEIERAVQDMYDDISIDHGYHGDDDFEQIYDRMLDNIEADYGSAEEGEYAGHDESIEEAPFGRDAYQRDYDSSVSGMGRRERDWDEGDQEPPNNFAIYINGKKWKVFAGQGYHADDHREQQQYRRLQDMCAKKSAATGKKWSVHATGEPATESVQRESIEQTGDNMRNLNEGEIQQASAIVTAKTMVDRVGRWIEELSGMENDTLLQLGDSIRDEMGQEQAKGFIEAVAPAIQQALENLKSTREALASGVRTLTGEEQSAGMLGAEPAGEPGAEMGGELGGEMGPAEPDAMNAEPADDFAAAEPAAGGLGDAGREQRESIQRSSNLLRVLAG